MENHKIQSLWAHLHCLAVLQQQGSFTATASQLGISKAAVSQRIAELERAAGLPLVRRTTRSVQLTDAGRQLAENTRHAFDDIASSFASVQDLADHPRGALRVTVPVAFARQQLVPRLRPFLDAHPDIRIELDLSDRLVPLEQEGFDLAIRHTATPPDTYVAWPLCETQSLLVASADYLARHGTPRHPDDLASHRCLHYPRPRGTATWTLERRADAPHAAGATRLTVPIASAFSASNSEVLRDVALQGQGIALVPDFSVQQALRDGQLQEVLPGWQPVGAFGSHIYALRPYSPQVPLAVRLFVDHLRSAFHAGFGMTEHPQA